MTEFLLDLATLLKAFFVSPKWSDVVLVLLGTQGKATLTEFFSGLRIYVAVLVSLTVMALLFDEGLSAFALIWAFSAYFYGLLFVGLLGANLLRHKGGEGAAFTKILPNLEQKLRHWFAKQALPNRLKAREDT